MTGARTAGPAIARPGSSRAAERTHAVIGPNAITRVAEAVTARHGPGVCRHVFLGAGLDDYLHAPPGEMVDEREVAALHAALIHDLGVEGAAEAAAVAGRRTGAYLLAHRIPARAVALLRRLPRPLAARGLLWGIGRHAWTFAGSGRFSHGFDRGGLLLRIEGSPICRNIATVDPACHYYAATFETVFAAVLGPGVRVVETCCEAAGAPACVFRVSWSSAPPPAGRHTPKEYIR